MKPQRKIGLGGGCHWCTEAVFQSLKGIYKVEQGFVSPASGIEDFSEAVVVYYDPDSISMKDLISIHLYTHGSTKNHSMRDKYRSAVYVFTLEEGRAAKKILKSLQQDFTENIITEVLDFGAFRMSEERFQNYYNKDTRKPFCKTYITPKLSLLMQRFSKHLLEKVHEDQ